MRAGVPSSWPSTQSVPCLQQHHQSGPGTIRLVGDDAEPESSSQTRCTPTQSNARPPWAAIGHLAMMKSWRLRRSRSAGDLTIDRRARDWSSYNIENDSIWGPLEEATLLLQHASLPREDVCSLQISTSAIGSSGLVPTSAVWAKHCQVSQPPMPTRPAPPAPPSRKSFPGSVQRSHIVTIDGRWPRNGAVQSKFVEHLPENRETLRRFGIEEGRRRRTPQWLHSLRKR